MTDEIFGELQRLSIHDPLKRLAELEQGVVDYDDAHVSELVKYMSLEDAIRCSIHTEELLKELEEA